MAACHFVEKVVEMPVASMFSTSSEDVSGEEL
jgi:hypothetical protein